MTRSTKLDVSSLTEEDRRNRCIQIMSNMINADPDLIDGLSTEAMGKLPWLIEYISPVANVVTQNTIISMDSVSSTAVIDELISSGWLHYVEDGFVDFTPVARSWIIQNAIQGADQ
jgi:hypothetical protein